MSLHTGLSSAAHGALKISVTSKDHVLIHFNINVYWLGVGDKITKRTQQWVAYLFHTTKTQDRREAD